MQLKCIQNTIETRWNRLHWPYPATEFIISVAENKRRISDCEFGTGSKALDDSLLCQKDKIKAKRSFNGKRLTSQVAQYQEPAPFPTSIKAFLDPHDNGEIRYVYFESPGTAYEWLICRRDLYDFAPQLFR